MRESAFRESVLNKLSEGVHRQGMLASALSYPGTPDTYLDYMRDMWIEFKIIPGDKKQVPKTIPTRSLPTAQQYRWMKRRWTAGKNVACLVGFKFKNRWHGFWLPDPPSWTATDAPDAEELMTTDDFANWIMQEIS